MVNGTITILGCGGSGGTPLATNYWGACDPNQPKNNRTRPSIMIRTERTCVVIDTGPEFRIQTMREQVDAIDAILYTHCHGDHVNGIDDLRYVAIKQRKIQSDENITVPIYGDEFTLNDLQSRFHYMFTHSPDGLYTPLVTPHLIKPGQLVKINELDIMPFSQIHGRGHSLGFKIGDVAYSTDVSAFTNESLSMIKGIQTWIVDCGQYGAETLTVHANMEIVLEWNKIVGAKQIYLTHLTPRCDYDTINSATPDYVSCAYDGQAIEFVS